MPELVAGAVVDASNRGAVCPQPLADIPPFFSNPLHISEECLSLHIARPANANITSESKLPALAWIPGGGGMYGSGSNPHTSPERLIELSVKLKTPVVFVGINYRVGIFGFAASDTLQEQKSMNIGMRDQRMALEWIQANIATFGGDPDRVTAYGLSAGGTYVALHQLAYGGEKGAPFSQAFIMSGPIGTALNQTSDQVRVNTAAVAEQLECSITGQKMLDCLWEVPMMRMMEVSYAYAQGLPLHWGSLPSLLVVMETSC